MNISKENNELVFRIPLTQKSYDAIDNYSGDVPNLIGVIGNEYSISRLIDLGYKGDQQEGTPLIIFDTEEELEKACSILGLAIWRHDICAECKKVIYGSMTLSDKGEFVCFDCA